MCLHLPVFPVSQTGVGRANAWPSPPLGTTLTTGACGFTPPFWWPDTLWAQLKAQPRESHSEKGDTDPVKPGNKTLSSMLDLPRKKAHFPWPCAQSKPITSSGGLKISPMLLNHPPCALLGVEDSSLSSLQKFIGVRLCVQLAQGMTDGENGWRKPQRPSERGDFPSFTAGRMRKTGALVPPFVTVLAWCLSVQAAAGEGSPRGSAWLMGPRCQTLGKDWNQLTASCLLFLHCCP